jgi:hypothetical protein
LGRPFAFYTGNKSVIEALQGKPDIFPITMLSPRELAGPKIKNKQLSATEVRRLIRARLRWEHLLPRSVVDALKKRGLVQRIMDTMGLKKVHKHQR